MRFPLQLCCIKCSPTLTGMLVLACLLHDLIICLVCAVVCVEIGVGDDPGKLGLSTLDAVQLLSGAAKGRSFQKHPSPP